MQPSNAAYVHPLALVEPGAELGEGVEIGPFCYVGPLARIGRRCRLLSHVTIQNRTTLGDDTIVYPQATLGAAPQDLKYRGEPTELIIGAGNVIREGVTAHIGTAKGGGVTRVGEKNLIMVGCHIAHDCLLGSHIIAANNVLFAGHVEVGDHAVISGGVGVHHFVTIGPHAFVGGLSRVVRDVPPYMTVEGNPSRVRGVNTVGLERRGFAPDAIDRLKHAFRTLYHRHHADESAVGDTQYALRSLEAEFPHDPHIAAVIACVRQSTEGVHGRAKEAQRTDGR